MGVGNIPSWPPTSVALGVPVAWAEVLLKSIAHNKPTGTLVQHRKNNLNLCLVAKVKIVYCLLGQYAS